MDETPKKKRGLKLHKNKPLEQEVVKWIVLEDVSTYEIVKRLEERHNYKIAPQSIESWKTNYLDDLKKDVRDFLTEEVNDNLDKINILVKLNGLAKIIDERVETLNKLADSKILKNDAGEVTNLSSLYEKMLKEYVELSITTREKILRYSPDFNVGDVIRNVIKQVATISFLLFNSEEDKVKYPTFKSELVDVEKRIREYYLLKELK